MSETVEVRSVLRLDDQSSGVVEKLKGGYEHLSEKVHHVQSEMGSMLRQTLAVAAGFEITHGIESVKELGHEVFAAAKGLGEEIKQITGAIAVGDKAGRSYEEIKEQAKGLQEELEGLAISAGASVESVIDAFSTIQARSNKSAEEVRGLTEELIFASRAVPGGMEGMANAYRDLEAGIIRPRNQLVQLMTMTGTVEGSARKVAKGLNAMFQAGQQEKVAKLAEEAISRMSEKMKNAPATFTQAVESLKAMRENVFQTMGVPILKAVTAPLQQMRKYFSDNREAVEHWARSTGEKVGRWITVAADKVKEGFKYLQSHAQEIKDAIVEAVSVAKSVVQWIIDHRELVAVAFGAKMAAPAVMGAAGMVGQGIGLVKSIAGAGAPAVGLAAGGGAVAFGVAVAAFAAAVGAWALATDQWAKLQNLTHGKSDAQQNEEARKERLDQLAKSTDPGAAGFDQLRAKFIEQADALDMDARAAGEYADAMWAQHAKLVQGAAELDEASKIADFGNDFEAASQWVVAYDRAVQQHNEALMKYAAGVIAGNQTLQNAFLAAGSNVEGGFEQLAELVGGKSEDFAKILKGMGGDAAKGKVPDKIALNFNNNTFNIKQEFRDGDPDRVLLSFRRDLVRQTVFRQSARVGTPFGM